MIDIKEKVLNKVFTDYYLRQNYDFGEFPPEDETHFEKVFSD